VLWLSSLATLFICHPLTPKIGWYSFPDGPRPVYYGIILPYMKPSSPAVTYWYDLNSLFLNIVILFILFFFAFRRFRVLNSKSSRVLLGIFSLLTFAVISSFYIVCNIENERHYKWGDRYSTLKSFVNGKIDNYPIEGICLVLKKESNLKKVGVICRN